MPSLLDQQPDDQSSGGVFDGLGRIYRAVTDYMAPQGGKSLLWPEDNPVGTETVQSMGMPQPTTYAGPLGEYINPQTGQLTDRGQDRFAANPAMGFDTGGIGMVGAMKVPGISVLKDGTIMAGRNPVGRVKYDHGDNFTRIADIQINPSMQNQGLGSTVIRQIQDEAAARGNPVVLSTDAFRGKQAQADQLRLYQRLGFVPNTGPGAVSERIGGRRVAEDLVWRSGN